MKFKYIDDKDRCYGATGMAISLIVWDAEDVLSSISIDAEPNEMMEFTQEYFFSGNPRISAKVAWNNILHHFQVSAGMLIGNVMCRSYINSSIVLDEEAKKALYDYINAEGHDTCSLEDDEIERMFDKSYRYLHQIFNHVGIRQIATDFARTLLERRTMSRSEVMEELHALHHI